MAKLLTLTLTITMSEMCVFATLHSPPHGPAHPAHPNIPHMPYAPSPHMPRTLHAPLICPITPFPSHPHSLVLCISPTPQHTSHQWPIPTPSRCECVPLWIGRYCKVCLGGHIRVYGGHVGEYSWVGITYIAWGVHRRVMHGRGKGNGRGEYTMGWGLHMARCICRPTPIGQQRMTSLI